MKIVSCEIESFFVNHPKEIRAMDSILLLRLITSQHDSKESRFLNGIEISRLDVNEAQNHVILNTNSRSAVETSSQHSRHYISESTASLKNFEITRLILKIHENDRIKNHGRDSIAPKKI